MAVEERGFLETPEGRRIAYGRLPGRGPGVVFLHGLQSDMGGTKVEALAEWAAAAGRAFLRFDVSGHGASSGRFEEGCIGDWFADARAAISDLTEGPQVIVGSSMGGWLALLVAREMPERVAALVTIAAAPDFTDGLWDGLSEAERGTVMEEGAVTGPDAFPVTRRLIEDGRAQRVLSRPLPLPFPVRLLHGAADEVVPVDRGLLLFDHAEGPDIRLVLVKGADHRFSAPAELDLLVQTIETLPL